jgi:hypothetical protein
MHNLNILLNSSSTRTNPTIPCRSESELLGNYRSYREKYLSLHPDFQSSIQNSANIIANETIIHYKINSIQL